MLLSITNRSANAGELGFLLHKHPDKIQSFDVTCGRARVFYPQTGDEICTAALLLDIDSVGMVRNDGQLTIHDYVNDRPYVASSMMSAAIRRVYGSALSGVCRDRPELPAKVLSLSAELSALQCWGGENLIRRMFEPLGYKVTVSGTRFDDNFPEWGDSPYFIVGIEGDTTLQSLLTHLYVLIPVLDNGKHYRLNKDEVEKLLKHGEGWLGTHPEQRLIVQRYLGYKRALADKALDQLNEPEVDEALAEGAITTPPSAEAQIEGTTLCSAFGKPESLHAQRHTAVIAALDAAGAQSVLDMGCNFGQLLERLAKVERLKKIVGFDVSAQVLHGARRRVGMKGRPKETDRVHFFVGSLFYTDERMRGFDAATCVEVIEHLEPSRLRDFEEVVFGFARPRTVVLTTPNIEYNVRFPNLEAGGLRHNDHRFEWTREQFRNWAETVAAQRGYTVTFAPVGPEDPEVGAPSQMAVFTVTEGGGSLVSLPAIDAALVLENRMVATRLLGNVGLDYGNRCAAFEKASRHTVDPRWMVYLPPTMSPSEASSRDGYLEHPAEALTYFRERGISNVVCQQKHMGSRAVVVVCRDEAAARRRFGVESGLGSCYTRMGRPFFNDSELEVQFIDRVRATLEAANVWAALDSDWVVLDCELMPWSAKAQGLIKKQYAALAVSSRTSYVQAVLAAKLAVRRGLPAEELLADLIARQDCSAKFQQAYRPYCWKVDSLSDYRLAPFHIMASEGCVHSDKDHVWHMMVIDRIARNSDGLIINTPNQLISVDSPPDCTAITHWWTRHTESGGEGMVVKPVEFVTRSAVAAADLVQPAIKCRGREYLRLIYGPDYTMEHNLSRLRVRSVKRKRWLAHQEFALGLEGLQRFVARQPLQNVHECVFAVLACESTPLDPRL